MLKKEMVIRYLYMINLMLLLSTLSALAMVSVSSRISSHPRTTFCVSSYRVIAETNSYAPGASAVMNYCMNGMVLNSIFAWKM